MKAFKESIDYEALENELHEALRGDELYSLQNDAKFRAIEQAVPTYEDFRQMVNAAHLKPLDRKDMTPKVGVKWNSIVNDNTNSNLQNKTLQKNVDRSSSANISFGKSPKNGYEFRSLWKKLDDHDDKFRLLDESRFALSHTIFRSEIPPDILTDCLATCLEALKSPNNKTLVIDIMSELCKCHRFKLAIEFMSEEDKFVCQELFSFLRGSATMKNERIIDDLEKKYSPSN